LVTTIKAGTTLSSFKVARTWRGGSQGSVVLPKNVSIPALA